MEIINIRDWKIIIKNNQYQVFKKYDGDDIDYYYDSLNTLKEALIYIADRMEGKYENL